MISMYDILRSDYRPKETMTKLPNNLSSTPVKIICGGLIGLAAMVGFFILMVYPNYSAEYKVTPTKVTNSYDRRISAECRAKQKQADIETAQIRIERDKVNAELSAIVSEYQYPLGHHADSTSIMNKADKARSHELGQTYNAYTTQMEEVARKYLCAD